MAEVDEVELKTFEDKPSNTTKNEGKKLRTNKGKGEVKEGEAHKFWHVKSIQDVVKRSSATLGYPVAMRRSRSKDSKSWTTVIARQQFGEPEKSIEQQVCLQTSTSYDWSGVLQSVCLLPLNVYWQVFVVATVMFSYVWTTFLFYFGGHTRLERPFYELYFTDSIYLIDFIIALLHCYWQKLHKLVKRRRLALIVDFISLLQLDVVYPIFSGVHLQTSVHFWLRSTTFLRLYRVLSFFSELADSAGGRHLWLFVTKYVSLLCLLLHTVACLWFYVGSAGTKSWTVMLHRFSMTITTAIDWYLISLYFSLVTILNCGLGDIMATNETERIIVVAAMMLGFFLTTGVYIGSFTSQIANDERRKALFTDELRAIKMHLEDIDMDPQSTRTILKYYEVLWIKRKGVKSARNFKRLPLPLQMEVCFDTSVEMFHNSLLFRDKSEPFLRKLSLLTTSTFHLPGEVIFHQNVAKNSMIHVHSGVLEILSDEDNESPIVSFTSGTLLGEIALVLTVPAKATVRVATYTELQVLPKADFFRMMVNFPYTHKLIMKEMFTRVDRAVSSQCKDKNPLKFVKEMLYDALQEKDAEVLDDHSLKNRCFHLYNICKNVPQRDSPNMCLKNRFPFILEPNSQLVKLWGHVVFVVVIAVSFGHPYFIGFNRGFPTWQTNVNVVCDFVYALDVMILCTTAVEKKDGYVTKVSAILTYRMQTLGFYFDVFSIFPIEVMAFLMEDLDMQKRMFDVLKLNRLLKAWRIPAYFMRLERNVWTNLIVLRIFKYILYLLLVSVWSGMLLYMAACFDVVCYENSWYNVMMEREIEMRDGHPCYVNPYMMSMYYSLNLLSAVGFGDILPESVSDMILTCACILFGVMFLGYCVAEFSATCSQMERSRVEYQEVVFATKKFMSENGSSRITDRVNEYFRLQWNYNKGISIVSNKDLFCDATWEFQQQVLVKERIEMLLNVPLFKDVDIDFLQLLAMDSSVQLLPSYEVISYAGGLSRGMYVVQEGFCEIISERTGEVLQVVGPNYHFGDLEMLYGSPRIFTIRSVTNCKVLFVGYRTYVQAASMFPSVMTDIEEVVRDAEFADEIKKMSAVETTRRSQSFEYKKRIRFMPHFATLMGHLKGSFVYVPAECHRRGENYWTPFNSLHKFSFIKFLLLPWCVLPKGSFIKYWSSLRIISGIVVSVYQPYLQAVSSLGKVYDEGLLALDVIAFVDLYLMLHFGYYNDRGILVVHPKCTALYHLKHNFLVDLVACLPFYSLLDWCTDGSIKKYSEPSLRRDGPHVEVNVSNTHVFLIFLRLTRVLQIYRLTAAIWYLERDILQKSTYLRVLKFVPFTFVIINTWASVLVTLNCAYVPLDGGRKHVQPGRVAHHHVTREPVQGYMACKDGSWLDDSHFENVTHPFEVYVVALYWVTTTFVGNGLSAISAQSVLEMAIMIFIMILGTLLFGYMFANICSGKVSLHNTLLRFQEMMTELIKFMESESVDKDLQRKLTDHFEYEWKRTNGVQTYDVLTKLHNSLMEDTVLEMYEDTLRKVPMFQNVDVSFFRVIGKSFREAYFLRGETIINSNDIHSDIYIVFRGKVEVLSEYNEMLTCMGPGSMFGNIGNAAATTCSVTVVAFRNLDLLVIPSASFYNVVQRYPTVKRKVDEALSSVRDYVMPAIIAEEEEQSFVWTQDCPEDMKRTEYDVSTLTGGTSIMAGTFVTVVSVMTVKGVVVNVLNPRNWFRFAILPESRIYTVMSFVVLACSYLDSLIVGYMFAFQDDHASVLVTSVCFESIFYVNIVLELHKAYLNRFGDYVMDNKEIWAHYVRNRGHFYLGIVSNFPLSILALAFPSGNRSTAFSILRLNHMTRIGYVVEYYRSRANLLMVNKLCLKTSTMFVWLTALAHFFTCLWYTVGCPLRKCCPYSWAYYARMNESTSSFEAYVVSLYYVSSLFTSNCYGDVLPHTIPEVVISITMMIICKFSVAMFIGDIALVVSSQVSTLVSYKHGIAETRDMLRNQDLSTHQMEKASIRTSGIEVWQYAKRLWKYGHGKQIPRFVVKAPAPLQSDLMYAIYGYHLQNSYIFANIGEDFLRQLAIKFKHCVFFEGNYIVQHGDVDQNMYFIHRGQVSILTIHANLTETIHDVLKVGDVFGVAQGLYHGLHHHFSFRAKTVVDLVFLHLDDWHHLLRYFPEIKTVLYKRAANIYSTM